MMTASEEGSKFLHNFIMKKMDSQGKPLPIEERRERSQYSLLLTVVTHRLKKGAVVLQRKINPLQNGYEKKTKKGSYIQKINSLWQGNVFR